MKVYHYSCIKSFNLNTVLVKIRLASFRAIPVNFIKVCKVIQIVNEENNIVYV